jgi:hypothetical protein
LWNKINYGESNADPRYCYQLKDFKVENNIIDHQYYCKMVDIFNLPDELGTLESYISKHIKVADVDMKEYIFSAVENSDIYLSPNRLADKILCKKYATLLVNSCIVISENEKDDGKNIVINFYHKERGISVDKIEKDINSLCCGKVDKIFVSYILGTISAGFGFIHTKDYQMYCYLKNNKIVYNGTKYSFY